MKSIEEFFNQEGQKLTSFIYRMTGNVATAQDLVQDTLMTALEKMEQFEGKSSLSTWIFSIASNKTIDLLRKEKRWTDNVMDQAKQASMNNPDFFHSLVSTNKISPAGTYEISEQIDLCFTCITKILPIEQEVALILKDVYAFTVPEISEIMGRTTSQIKHYLEDARAKMIQTFDQRCALINKNGVCNQCTELNGIFNPKQDAAQKKREIQFVREKDERTKEELYELRTNLVSHINPLASSGHELHQKHLDFICEIAKT